jgi:hypothetical protein
MFHKHARVLAVVAALLIVGGAAVHYSRAGGPCRWVIAASSSHPGCVIEEGWRAEQVSAVCGEPRGGGTQPKVGARADGSEHPFCAAPCEVFVDTLVLYGCDGGVFDIQPVSGEWRCSVSMKDEGWERGNP